MTRLDIEGVEVAGIPLQADENFTLKVILDEDSDYTGELQFDFAGPGAEGYIIGRSDSASNYEPDIDLAPFNAQKRGISRRHAAIVRYKGVIHILDLGSMNGTFVNSRRLPPKVAQSLKIGDQLRFANLSIIISS